ncbi:CHAT domain-containing protein [Amycolatopsis sp. WQ 127309]|uniref:CHAT domain-containing protein n=1 Tax=Amycolatopsis sp. WQ 127309 TaxID=2932773 RepID=UPI001FF4A146|nr:CHAT domain-containing protein [Amycolatopsis sp. WQ 127309]UOZ03499.1 CHAT domain-containing protein [Amycolatopsis sp. WQ 127309]
MSAAERLGWRPIPDVPRRFRRLLDKADDALGHHLDDGESAGLTVLVEILDRLVADRRFASGSPAFQQAVLNRASIAHNWRGINTGKIADIETSVDLLTEGLRLAPDGSPEQARMECNLGSSFIHLYREYGDAEFLVRATGHLRRSMAAAGDDATLLALGRSHLGSVLQAQFIASGEAALLTEAVHLAELCMSEAPARFDYRYSLAKLLFTRYTVHGALDDLDRAITLLREATGKPGPDGVARNSTDHGASLGMYLRDRYLRTRSPADLAEAIQLLQDDVDLGEDGEPTAVDSLGSALLTRYHDFGDESDVHAAIDLHRLDLARSSPGNWQLAATHNNLANALETLSRITGDPETGAEAVEHYRSSLRLTSGTAPNRTSRSYNLGRLLQAQSDRSGDTATAAEAVGFYRDALRHGLESSLEWALSAGRAWGDWATRRERWDEACTAYESALEATRRLFRTQVLREDRETWLAESQGLPAAAAYAMFRAGRLEDAVLALESGRSLLLSEVLERERIELDGLAGTEHADLVRRYRVATTALDGALWQGAESRVLRAHREAIDEVIDGIRGVPGYERFLRAPTISDVRDVITDGTVVVYVAAAGPAGVALGVGSGGDVRAVELPSATAAAVQQRANVLLESRRGMVSRGGAWEGTLDAVTRWAWPAIMAPVRLLAGTAQRIVLVPSGRVTMLPLHAAWTPERDGRRYALDDQVVTYAPTARSLSVTDRIAARTPATRLAVIADPRPSAWEPIGYTRAETAWARHWFPTSDVLAGEQANFPAVRAALTTADVHHFICHGKAHPDEPLKSALVLAGDDELTLREILALRLADTGPGVRLAVLSACDTDQPGSVLPDEVISLPTGLIQAGVAGVVATRWAVRSEAVSLLLARFYQLWRAEGREPASALQAAQRWLRDTTNGEKARDLAAAITPIADPDLVGLVRALYLRDPDERAYRHPADWAALSYHGS